MSKEILKEIYFRKNPRKAKALSGFFKTGKGQYGEGDIFFGLTVPVSRKIATKFKDISLSEIGSLLESKIHEARLIALLILVWRCQKGDFEDRKKIARFYLKNTRHVNNWDLVDISAPKILGNFLLEKNNSNENKEILLKLINSKNLWEQRMAVVSTFAFIKKEKLYWTFKIAKIFLKHEHDLIHKATGWMLREAGKKNVKALREFLDINVRKMPRTMLRYAIEKFPENLRLEYLKK